MRITLANWCAIFLGHCKSVKADCKLLLLMDLQKNLFFGLPIFREVLGNRSHSAKKYRIIANQFEKLFTIFEFSPEKLRITF